MIYLLDTNILLAYLREPNLTQKFVDKNFAPLSPQNKVTVCIVTVGEIKAISLKNGWGKNKIAKIEQTLNKVIIADISDKEIIELYAEIDAFSQCRLVNRQSNFTA